MNQKLGSGIASNSKSAIMSNSMPSNDARMYIEPVAADSHVSDDTSPMN